MPGEVDWVGAEGGLGREGQRAAVEVGEFEVAAAWEDGFGNIGLGDLDVQVSKITNPLLAGSCMPIGFTC